MDTQKYGEMLKDRGYDFYSGVPCSFLKDLINYSINECEYIMAANEGDAVAICAGAQIAGRKTIVLIQNSGLGNAVSPLTSLNAVFKIPILGFVSLRGEPGLEDEPQHDLMGIITEDLLTAMKIKWAYLSCDLDEAKAQLNIAEEIIGSKESFFFIVRKGTFSTVPLRPEKKIVENIELPNRDSMLRAIRKNASAETVIAATTGFTGRELYELGDDERNFYMVGSLGCLSSFCLGLSLAVPDRAIIILDGDGSVLMRTGALPVVATYKPRKILHVLLDNRAYESTGGQASVSAIVEWSSLALAAGYSKACTVHSSEEMALCVSSWQREGGLIFVHARIRQGAPGNLGRPKTKPIEVANRLAAFLKR